MLSRPGLSYKRNKLLWAEAPPLLPHSPFKPRHLLLVCATALSMEELHFSPVIPSQLCHRCLPKLFLKDFLKEQLNCGSHHPCPCCWTRGAATKGAPLPAALHLHCSDSPSKAPSQRAEALCCPICYPNNIQAPSCNDQ